MLYRDNGVWKSAEGERALRKWGNWSAHFAWGGLIVLALSRVVRYPWAWLISLGCGIVWELAWSVFGSKPEHAAGVIDAVTWVLGSIAGVLLVIFIKRRFHK